LCFVLDAISDCEHIELGGRIEHIVITAALASLHGPNRDARHARERLREPSEEARFQCLMDRAEHVVVAAAAASLDFRREQKELALGGFDQVVVAAPAAALQRDTLGRGMDLVRRGATTERGVVVRGREGVFEDHGVLGVEVAKVTMDDDLNVFLVFGVEEPERASLDVAEARRSRRTDGRAELTLEDRVSGLEVVVVAAAAAPMKGKEREGKERK